MESDGCGNAIPFAHTFLDVDAVWMKLSLQNVTTFHAKFPDMFMFFYFKVEETCHMAFGNDERMTKRDWKTVVDSQCQTVFYKNVTNFKMAERAGQSISIQSIFF